jgi:glutamine synthetase
VTEAAKRGLLNLPNTPDALAQLRTQHAKDLFSRLNVLTEAELESRYHVRLERYIKDILIEANTLREMVDTFVVPAALAYAGALAASAQAAKGAGIRNVPHVAEADRIGGMVEELDRHRTSLRSLLERVESMHDEPEKLAQLLTRDGRATMEAVRRCCDALEMSLPDESWPLPKYREMLFPV